MPTLIVEDVPGEVYEQLQQQAQAERRTLSEEAVRLLRQGLNPRAAKTPAPAEESKIAVSPRLPSAIILDTGEMSPPCDLPRPEPGIQVPARFGGERLPEPFALPENEETNDV